MPDADPLLVMHRFRPTTPPPGNGSAPQTTTTFYNELGRAWKMVEPDGTSVTNEFFPGGELKKTSGSRRYPVEYTYDDQGRKKTMKTWQNFAGNSGAATTTWNYDPYRGFLTSKIYQDGNGTVNTYTAAGRLATRKWARGSPQLTTTYTYDKVGTLATVSYSDGTTANLTHAYDRLGRPTSVTQGAMTTTRFFHDSGRQIGEAYTGGTLNGLAVTNTLDSLLRPSQNQSKNGTTGLSVMNYGYDVAGRLESVGEGTYSGTSLISG